MDIKKQFYFTYVLRSLKDWKLYIGHTKELWVRLEQHNRGMVRSTKSREPLELVYFEACLSKVDAIEREKQLKTGFGRAYLKRRLKGVFRDDKS